MRSKTSVAVYDSRELSPMYEFSVSFVEPLKSMIVGSIVLILIMMMRRRITVEDHVGDIIIVVIGIICMSIEQWRLQMISLWLLFFSQLNNTSSNYGLITLRIHTSSNSIMSLRGTLSVPKGWKYLEIHLLLHITCISTSLSFQILRTESVPRLRRCPTWKSTILFLKSD